MSKLTEPFRELLQDSRGCWDPDMRRLYDAVRTLCDLLDKANEIIKLDADIVENMQAASACVQRLHVPSVYTLYVCHRCGARDSMDGLAPHVAVSWQAKLCEACAEAQRGFRIAYRGDRGRIERIMVAVSRSARASLHIVGPTENVVYHNVIDVSELK